MKKLTVKTKRNSTGVATYFAKTASVFGLGPRMLAQIAESNLIKSKLLIQALKSSLSFRKFQIQLSRNNHLRMEESLLYNLVTKL